ncbi:MAG: TonB family protein [Gemmatimonadales bacterium]|nr:TonB family protein [Gemmatimonadales bacterium]
MLLALACGTEQSGSTPDASRQPTQGFEPPVAVNAESPIAYPPELYEEGVEGTVVLRLFVDETGAVVPESTRIAEGSGYLELDSAALAGVAAMHFAPAWRDGAPVATLFLQPVHFRHPDSLPSGG